MAAKSLLPADQLPAEIAHFLRPELPPLGPGRPQHTLEGLLHQADPNSWKRRGGALSIDAAACCKSGLWLWNGFLEASHSLSQAIHTAEGSWWHGIMHRREPDYGNGKYWFRRVGHHPCFDKLAPLAEQALDECGSFAVDDWKHRVTGSNGWDGAAFIDLCQTAEQSSDLELTTAAKRIQWAEMLLLLEHSYRQASGLKFEPS